MKWPRWRIREGALSPERTPTTPPAPTRLVPLDPGDRPIPPEGYVAPGDVRPDGLIQGEPIG